MKRRLTDITQDCSIDDALMNKCIFIPDEQAQGTFASLMYNRSLDHVGVLYAIQEHSRYMLWHTYKNAATGWCFVYRQKFANHPLIRHRVS